MDVVQLSTFNVHIDGHSLPADRGERPRLQLKETESALGKVAAGAGLAPASRRLTGGRSTG